MLARGLVGLLLGCTLAVALAPPLIRFLRDRGAQAFHWRKQNVDNRLFYELHQKKIGTPSMGGLLMLLSTALVAAALFPSAETWVFLAGFVAFSLLGMADDVSKALVKAGVRADDLAAGPKMLVQWGLGLAVGGLLFGVLGRHTIGLPFVGAVDLAAGYIVAAAFVMVVTANAVNVTDGLDGLAGGLLVLCLTAFAAIAWLRGATNAAGLAAALTGATLGFLAFNIHPARVFMGDVGAMGLGAGLALVALLSDALAPLLVVAGVLAVELLSSLIQTMALRRGKRVFKIAPLHHHLEALGWPETRITETFWLVGALLAYAGVLVSLQ